MSTRILQEPTSTAGKFIYMLQNEHGEYWMGPRLNTWEAPKEKGADVPCWITTSKEGAECQAALLDCHPPESGAEAFMRSIDASISFHLQNQNDPHNIGNAVVTALMEVKKAGEASMKADGIFMITTQATTYGTAHFQSVEAAIRHFDGTIDNPRAFVAHSIAAGDVVIGRPLLRHGQTLAVINGRYHVTEGAC